MQNFFGGFFILSLIFSASAFAQNKFCTLGGSDVDPHSGAMSTRAFSEADCRKECEKYLEEGVVMHPAWKEHGYTYRCAFDGKFIAFDNKAPVPKDKKVIAKHKEDTERVNERLKYLRSLPQCVFGGSPTDKTQFLGSSPDQTIKTCPSFCHKNRTVYSKEKHFKEKVAVAKCWFDGKEIKE